MLLSLSPSWFLFVVSLLTFVGAIGLGDISPSTNPDTGGASSDQRNQWLFYASIPIVASVVGYGTNVAAVYLTFFPVEFIGVWKPFLGWQGIVPRKAEKMATIAVDAMTSELITPEEIFARLDPVRLAEEFVPSARNSLEETITASMKKRVPVLWNMIPVHIRDELVTAVQEELPLAVEDTFAELQQNLSGCFDTRGYVIDSFVQDKMLLINLFRVVGRKELRAIEASGAVFGLLFGLIQMIIWVYYKGWWILPVSGFVVGYATNWVALKIIFEPVEPVDLGCYRLQGLFLKRQEEVSVEFAKISANGVLSAAVLMKALCVGKWSSGFVSILTRNIHRSIDEYLGMSAAVIQLAYGAEDYEALKTEITSSMMRHLPSMMEEASSYAQVAMDLETTIRERMRLMSPSSFERMLHPVFEEDEIILILVGAGLGALVGFGQALLNSAITV